MDILLIALFQITMTSSSVDKITVREDTIPVIYIFDDPKSLVGDRDSIELKELSMMDLRSNQLIINWGTLQSGVTIVRKTDEMFIVKGFVNLPLNGIDSEYVRIDIIHFEVTYLPDQIAVIEIDEDFTPSLKWNENNIQNTKVEWNKLSQNANLHKEISELSEYECGLILYLNYGLMYSILKGDKESAKYFSRFEQVFPSITELTMGEEYSSNKKILYYYQLID